MVAKVTRPHIAQREPCLYPWGEWDWCPLTASGHECKRASGHNGRHHCRCGGTTTITDPIFEDPEELEAAQEALDG